MTELANMIEAILFYQAEPLSVKRLATLLKRSESDITEALRILGESLSGTGLRLLSSSDEVTLGTAPEAGALIEAITKEELSRELSKASLETLAIVLYKGPITRAEIDYIRGVNSTFILRNLLVRGLVEKIDNPKDQRSFLYQPTFQLLEFMGVERVSSLPEYDATMSALEQFMTTKSEEDTAIAQKESETADVVGVVPEPEGEDEQESDRDTDAEFAEGNTAVHTEEELGEADVTDEISSPEVLADVLEEDEAVGNFSDEALDRHLQEDEERL